jgi:Flp pilus assembly protein TadG
VKARRTSRRRGASAVELALCAPLLFTFVFGVIELSRMGMVTQILVTGAREGCRVAVVQNSTLADVQQQANATLAASGIAAVTVRAVGSDPGTNGAFIMPSNWDTAPGGTPVTLTLRMPFTQVSWLPSPFYLKSAVMVGSATLSSERP